MKIPKFIYIKGSKWKVRRKKKIVHEDGDICHGLTDPDTKIIFLESNLEGKHLESVFWHEYTHAVMYEAGVTDTTNGVPVLAEEIICDAMADSLVKNTNIEFKRKRK